MSQTPTVETQMLIRKPVAEVFQAFIDPSITTKFWFTKSSGRLEVGETVKWEWEMYGVSTNVFTKEIIPNQLISTEWGDPATTVDYVFTPFTDDTTYVVIKNYGFNLTGDDLIRAIKDNTGGFTSVLDGLKAYLEHNIQLNLVLDKFPNKLNTDPKTLNEWQKEM
ncbi:SRPBCC family protein [Chitinophagaceae bacterium LB-8]|uniref:SRPBCC family protein n=1 Tax=Paraflavisolibacter caeni TaxID=2982496 RepID=A0A9X3B888_9BACT|nr:SRPBCC family protein [Paraflavisolibacter caeni]MCU7549366.1 SRPBCC family protein [Paraflavisolibacter caeni]